MAPRRYPQYAAIGLHVVSVVALALLSASSVVLGAAAADNDCFFADGLATALGMTAQQHAAPYGPTSTELRASFVRTATRPAIWLSSDDQPGTCSRMAGPYIMERHLLTCNGSAVDLSPCALGATVAYAAALGCRHVVAADWPEHSDHHGGAAGGSAAAAATNQQQLDGWVGLHLTLQLNRLSGQGVSTASLPAPQQTTPGKLADAAMSIIAAATGAQQAPLQLLSVTNGVLAAHVLERLLAEQKPQGPKRSSRSGPPSVILLRIPCRRSNDSAGSSGNARRLLDKQPSALLQLLLDAGYIVDQVQHGHNLHDHSGAIAPNSQCAASMQLVRRFSDSTDLDAIDNPERCKSRHTFVAFRPRRMSWHKYGNQPVHTAPDGSTMFDLALLPSDDGQLLRLWGSWRYAKCISLSTSADGKAWAPAACVLGAGPAGSWEEDVNRPAVVQANNKYYMWYTGQGPVGSAIGLATSTDGISWVRHSPEPVLVAEQPWELDNVMCPHVIWDEAAQQFRMWYSAGEKYEPDAVGYAVSDDGVTWEKPSAAPVFGPDRSLPWERVKVAGVQVLQYDNWHIMLYICYETVDLARICMARSRDGVTGWQRLPENPILEPTRDGWDGDAVYKPFVVPFKGAWYLYYNGRKGHQESIGLAINDRPFLDFTT